jgi:hypothetical protein
MKNLILLSSLMLLINSAFAIGDTTDEKKVRGVDKTKQSSEMSARHHQQNKRDSATESSAPAHKRVPMSMPAPAQDVPMSEPEIIPDVNPGVNPGPWPDDKSQSIKP